MNNEQFTKKRSEMIHNDVKVIERMIPNPKDVLNIKKYLTDFMEFDKFSDVAFNTFNRLIQNGMYAINKKDLKDKNIVQILEERYHTNFAKVRKIWKKMNIHRSEDEIDMLNDFYLGYIAYELDRFDMASANDIIVAVALIDMILSNSTASKKVRSSLNLYDIDNVFLFLRNKLIPNDQHPDKMGISDCKISSENFIRFCDNDWLLFDADKEIGRFGISAKELYDFLDKRSSDEMTKQIVVQVRQAVKHPDVDFMSIQDPDELDEAFKSYFTKIEKKKGFDEDYPYFYPTGISYFIKYELNGNKRKLVDKFVNRQESNLDLIGRYYYTHAKRYEQIKIRAQKAFELYINRFLNDNHIGFIQGNTEEINYRDKQGKYKSYLKALTLDFTNDIIPECLLNGYANDFHFMSDDFNDIMNITNRINNEYPVSSPQVAFAYNEFIDKEYDNHDVNNDIPKYEFYIYHTNSCHSLDDLENRRNHERSILDQVETKIRKKKKEKITDVESFRKELAAKDQSFLDLDTEFDFDKVISKIKNKGRKIKFNKKSNKNRNNKNFKRKDDHRQKKQFNDRYADKTVTFYPNGKFKILNPDYKQSTLKFYPNGRYIKYENRIHLFTRTKLFNGPGYNLTFYPDGHFFIHKPGNKDYYKIKWEKKNGIRHNDRKNGKDKTKKRYFPGYNLTFYPDGHFFIHKPKNKQKR